MTPRRRGARWIGGGVLLALQLAFCWWLPNHRLSDARYLAGATHDEARRTAERVLRLPWGNHHDACVILERIGDERSISALRMGLRWEGQPDGDLVSDTWAHCSAVLARLESAATRAPSLPPPPSP